MSTEVELRGYHHLTLTVTDIERAREFYTGILGLKVIAEISPTWFVAGNEHMFIGVTEPTNPERAVANDRFNENRVGLDHLSFAVASREDIERAQKQFAAAGVRHAEIKDLPDFGITVMMFWDPDGMQLELSAPLS
ncbi:MAG: VOC family protein [Chloroflexota bacterium]|jgi:catechol 2,3-dioxygenase-like lactoylglutathione lyase family enzyme